MDNYLKKLKPLTSVENTRVKKVARSELPHPNFLYLNAQYKEQEEKKSKNLQPLNIFKINL